MEVKHVIVRSLTSKMNCLLKNECNEEDYKVLVHANEPMRGYKLGNIYMKNSLMPLTQ